MDKEIWEELKILNEAEFTPDNLQRHEKHKDQFHFKSLDEYNKFTHELTKHPALPIGQGSSEDVIGYINQNGLSIKFTKFSNNTYAFSVYSGDPETGDAVTCFPRSLNSIMRIADPYRFYRKESGKQGDYRYRSDINGGFEGLKFFDEHPEYHKDTDEGRINEIREKILHKERLRNFNTDKE